VVKGPDFGSCGACGPSGSCGSNEPPLLMESRSGLFSFCSEAESSGAMSMCATRNIDVTTILRFCVTRLFLRRVYDCFQRRDTLLAPSSSVGVCI
jgi:hypothetical protein